MPSISKKQLVAEFESIKDIGELRPERIGRYLHSLNLTTTQWNMLHNLFYAYIGSGEDVIKFEEMEIGE